MEFIFSYWCLGALIVAFIGVLIVDYTIAIKHAKSMIIQAEKYARTLALRNGQAKFNWVVSQYSFLPNIVKLAISEELFAKIVQFVFDKIKDKLEGDC